MIDLSPVKRAPRSRGTALAIAAAVECIAPGVELVESDDGRTFLVWQREVTTDEANRVHAYVIRLLKAAGA